MLQMIEHIYSAPTEPCFLTDEQMTLLGFNVANSKLETEGVVCGLRGDTSWDSHGHDKNSLASPTAHVMIQCVSLTRWYDDNDGETKRTWLRLGVQL